MKENARPNLSAAQFGGVGEKKYSLPSLLEELKSERAADAFAMEKLNQKEIAQLFKAKGSRGNDPA